MAASAVQQILARIGAALLGATPAGARVDADRVDAYSRDEMPALNVVRLDPEYRAAGHDIDEITVRAAIQCYVRGAAWRADADALHMAVHAALFADAVLHTPARALRCVSSTVQADPGDLAAGVLIAEYTARVIVARDDHTTPRN